MEFVVPEDSGKKDNDAVWKVLSDLGVADVDTYTPDEPFGMTNARAIAKWLSKYRWYYPAGGSDTGTTNGTAAEESTGLLKKKQPPKASLDEAWYYFEHFVLPRRFCKEDGGRITSSVDCVKAPAGEVERPTRLYSPLHTSMHELSDFGIGIGLYFSLLRGVAIIMMIAAIIHIPNFLYYSSSDYSNNGQSAVKTVLRGSAICTDNEWVPCPSCKLDEDVDDGFDLSDITMRWKKENWAINRMVESEDGLVFGLKNTCAEGDDEYLYARGIISWIGTIFIVIALLAFGEYQRKLAVEFDERNITATDFSIELKNPPKDAVDANEWKAYLENVAAVFLEKNGTDTLGGNGAAVRPRDTHITTITVALNNHELTDALISRRKLKKGIMNAMDIDEEEFDKVCATAKANEAPSVEGSAKKKMAKLLKLDETIEQLQQRTYDAMRIFVSCETEICQRAILTALSVSKVALSKNDASALDDEAYLFRGSLVMDAEEPPEPLTVRFRDLGIPKREKKNKRFSTMIISLLIVIGAFLLVRHVFLTYGAGLSALFIAILNILTPPVCRAITNIEIHSDDGGRQASHSVKVLGLRCVNSAVIIHLVTPFTVSLANGEHLIKAVAAIFIAEMFTAPIVQALFIPGIIKMHIVAPRCKDQQSMNQCFEGMPWELGERYTNIMKVLFLCFFFSAIFPGSFALSSVLLFIHYEFDKFCLMRVWARTGSIGADVADQNRSYIVPGLLVLLACMNAYHYSAFPMDDLCPSNDSTVPDEYLGDHILNLDDETVSFKISSDDNVYYACDQDLLNFPIQFPPLPIFQGSDHWMTESQEAIVRLHCWTSIGIIGVAVVYVFFLSSLAERIQSIFTGTYEPSGEIDGTDFSDVPGEIFEAYVPQLKVKGFNFPLIACDISNIDPRFIGWKDEDGDHDEHVLFNDLPPEVTGNKAKPIFSIMKHWKAPPSAQSGFAPSVPIGESGVSDSAEGGTRFGSRIIQKIRKKASPSKGRF